LRHLPVPAQLRLGVDLADVVVGAARRFDAGAGGGGFALAARPQRFGLGLRLEEIAFGSRSTVTSGYFIHH
jgi:hypothetical protein